MTHPIGRSYMPWAMAALILLMVYPPSIGPAQAAEHTDSKPIEAKSSAQAGVERDADPVQEHRWGPNYTTMWSIYFLGGAAFMDYDELNDRLDNEGYTELENPSLSLGIGGDFRWKRLILGGEAIWLQNVQGESSRDDTKSDISAFYALFRAGVVVFEWAGLSVYPLLGIGWGNIDLEIATIGGATFDDILADPAREVEMNQSGLLLDASLGVDYRFTLHESKSRHSLLVVGLRGGYLFAPYTQSWDMSGGEISSSPEFGLSGPTGLLVLGFSSRITGDHGRSCFHECWQKNGRGE